MALVVTVAVRERAVTRCKGRVDDSKERMICLCACVCRFVCSVFDVALLGPSLVCLRWEEGASKRYSKGVVGDLAMAISLMYFT